MVDKLILLDALPVVLDTNVRTGLARPVSLGIWVPGSVFSPAPLGGYQGGRRRWQTVDKRAQGPPPRPQGQGCATYSLGVGSKQGHGPVSSSEALLVAWSLQKARLITAAGVGEGRSSGLRKP